MKELPLIQPTDHEHLEPNARAICAQCGWMLNAKCGVVNQWHWAHEPDAPRSCYKYDPAGWHWHEAWMLHVERESDAEVDVAVNRVKVDLLYPDGRAVMLVRDRVDARRIAEVEAAVDRVAWVYRCHDDWFDRLWNKGDGWFSMSNPPRTMWAHRRPVIWHHRDRLHQIASLVEIASDHRLRFQRGEADQYGPVLYGSTEAPFDTWGAQRYMTEQIDTAVVR